MIPDQKNQEKTKMKESTKLGRIGAARKIKAEYKGYVKYTEVEEKLIKNIIKAIDKYEDYLYDQLLKND